jgi:hypothetical protein
MGGDEISFTTGIRACVQLVIILELLYYLISSMITWCLPFLLVVLTGCHRSCSCGLLLVVGVAECHNCLFLWLCIHPRSYMVWLAAMGVLL